MSNGPKIYTLLKREIQQQQQKNGLKRTKWWVCCGLPGICPTICCFFFFLFCAEKIEYQLFKSIFFRYYQNQGPAALSFRQTFHIPKAWLSFQKTDENFRIPKLHQQNSIIPLFINLPLGSLHFIKVWSLMISNQVCKVCKCRQSSPCQAQQ